MELTEEQKARIQQEELQRIAEEQYRQQVRRQLEGQAGATSAVPPKSGSPMKVLFGIVAIMIVLCSGVILISKRRPAEATPPPSGSASVGLVPAKVEKPSPTQPAAPVPMTTAQIAEMAAPFVVMVENYNENGQIMGQGSGYVFSPDDGIVITNYHVIRGASALTVKVPSKGESRVGSLLGYNIENDVAVLEIPPQKISPGSSKTASEIVDDVIRRGDVERKRRTQQMFSNMADRIAGRLSPQSPPVDGPTGSDRSSNGLKTEPEPGVKVGDRVVAIGAPLGLENTVSEGIVSAIRENASSRIIQTTASISPGSSGGPLLNEYGKVIGLTTATVRDGQNLNFVIPSSCISELLAARRRLSIVEMLSETRVSAPLLQSTIPVPARSSNSLQFTIPFQQGATLQGSYSITGGSGNDLGVFLLGPGNAVIVNSGRVSRFGQFKQHLPRGQYAVFFDNRFSNFSGKSVSPDLAVTYYK